MSHGLVRYGGKTDVKLLRANILRAGPHACIRVRYEQEPVTRGPVYHFPKPIDSQEVLDKITALYRRAPEAAETAASPERADALRQYKVRCAAVAGWWVFAVGYGLVFLSWLIYLVVISVRPGWFQSLWGQDVCWSYIQNMWMWGLVAFKLCVRLPALVAL